MEKKYRIILYVAGFFIALGVIYAIAAGLSKPQNNSTLNQGQAQTATTTTSILQLSQQEEAGVREFVKNFLTLYNNYSYGDFNNLTALGDYETQNMQQETLDTVNGLQSSVPIGYSQNSEPDFSTFSYEYPNPNTVVVTIQVKIIKSFNNQNEILTRSSVVPQTQNSTEVLTLQSYGQSWLVSDLQISPTQQ